jgi:hypothetical protein
MVASEIRSRSTSAPFKGGPRKQSQSTVHVRMSEPCALVLATDFGTVMISAQGEVILLDENGAGVGELVEPGFLPNHLLARVGRG